jgi:hypothetical protein
MTTDGRVATATHAMQDRPWVRRIGATLLNPRPWHVALVYALLLWTLIAGYARNFNGNLSGFICMGDRFIRPETLPSRVIHIPNCVGYDGQFFYFIAHDPLILGSLPGRLDRPAYRYQRILYPALASAASLGKAKRIPRMLVAVNAVALCLGVWMLAAYMTAHGRNAWTGAMLGLLSGCLLGLYRDMCDPLAAVLLVAAFIAWEQRRLLSASAFLAAALLTRETSAIVIPLLAAEALLRRDWKGLSFTLLSVVPFACWQIYIAWQFGEPSWRGGTGNFGAPLTAVWHYGREVFDTGSGNERAYFAFFLAQAACCLPIAAVNLWKRRDAAAVAFVAFAVMPFFMSRFVWVEPWSYGRVLVTGAAMLLLSHGHSRGHSLLTWIPVALNAALTVVTLVWLRVL